MPKLVFKDVELTSTTLNLELIADENKRKSNEQSRISSEAIRESKETERNATYATIKTDEATRKTDENTRKTAESTRVTDENTRKSNETTRQSQETTRQNFYNAYKVHETYSPTKAYVVNNKVRYQGGTYLCIVNTTNNAPSYNTDNTWWVCLAAKGQDGTGVGDMVASVYDPQNKHVDVFEYADNYYNALTGAIENKLDANKVVDSDTVTEDGYAYAAKRGKALRDDLNAIANTVSNKANDDHVQALDKGGTGATTVAQAKVNLGLDKVNNTADSEKTVKSAESATKATQDANGSNIANTYATKASPAFTGTPNVAASAAYTTAMIRNIQFTTVDPGANTASTLPNGSLLIVYE